jgi:hypothetical protein
VRTETFTTISSSINELLATGAAQPLSAVFMSGYSGYTAGDEVNVPCRAVSIIASATNVSAVGIGPAGGLNISSGYPLEAGEAITMEIDNLDKIQFIGTDGDRISWIIIR